MRAATFFAFAAGWVLCAAVQAPAQPGVPGLEELLARVAVYEHGQSRAALADLSDLVSNSLSDPARVRAIEAGMIRFLGAKATSAGRDAICRHLSVIGGETSVPVLSGLLGVQDTAEMARYALERMRGPAVDRTLRDAVGSAKGNTRIGIINTLGARGDAQAVPVLAKLVWDADAGVAAASVAALGKISGPEAAKALAQVRGKAQGALKMQALESSLACADKLADRGSSAAATATAIYKELSAASQPTMIRIGALSGLAQMRGRQALPPLVEAARDKDPKVQAASIGLIAAIPGAEAADALLAELPKLPEPARVQVLYALGDRGDPSARGVLVGSASAAEEAVRVAALTGLGRIGDSSDVKLLAARAAESQGAEQTAARDGLSMMRAPGVDEAIVSGVAGGTPRVKLELIRACGERVIVACSGALLSTAREQDPALRREALRALRETAAQEHITSLADLMVSLKDPDRREAGRALAGAMRRFGNNGASDLTSRYSAAYDSDLRAALLEVMGQLGTDELLPALRKGLAESDSDVRRVAILAATEWPAPAPLGDLLQMAEKDTSATHRVLALRGVLRLIPLANSRTQAENAALLRQAWTLATQTNEKRGVLSLLPRFPSKDTLDLAAAAANDPAVAKEAKTALESIRKSLEAAK